MLENFLRPLIKSPLEYFGSAEDARKIYVVIESDILENSLRWKTNFVTVASFIHELFCAHRMLSKPSETDTSLDRLLDEALFRSYVCVQGKNPFLINSQVS